MRFATPILVVTALCGTALANPAVTFTPASGPFFVLTQIPAGSGHWRVDLYTSVTASPTVFTILTNASETLEVVTVYASTSQTVKLDITGNSSPFKVTSIDGITFGTPTNATIEIHNLLVSGNVGFIAAHVIETATIDGSITSGVTLPARSGGG